MVGDHDVHQPGTVARLLGETLRTVRATGGADAFLGADRDLPPGPVLDPGHQFVAIAGLGIGRPLVQPLDLPAHRGHGRGIEQGLPRLLRRPAVQPVPAQVVATALEDRERRGTAEQRFQCRGKTGQVTVDQLALQRDRRGCHHDAGAVGHGMGHGGHQVGERLASPGAGLDRQVLTGGDGVLHRLRHRDLAGPLCPADSLDRRGEQRGHLGPGVLPGRACRLGRALLLTGRHTRNATAHCRRRRGNTRTTAAAPQQAGDPALPATR